MIDCRRQIADALLTVCDNVKGSRPEGRVVLPLITYAEVTNVNTSRYEDRIEYQVDVYTNNFEQLIQTVKSVSETLEGMGWHRTYVTPDSQARVETGLYKKSLNFTARVDTRINNILGGF